MNATRDYATLEGDSLILTKSNIRYTYTFDEENQLIKAVAETIEEVIWNNLNYPMVYPFPR